MKWKTDHIPQQTGKIAIVTGANSGIGLEAARLLAQKGSQVIMACRSLEKGHAAAESIRATGPSGDVQVSQLDLGSLESVKNFAENFNASHDRLDLLIANAGVMMPPRRTETADGFELQLGTNHLGHFALVGRLLPPLLATPSSRVVVVSSIAHKTGSIDFDDLNWQSQSYGRMKAYGQSKLANLLFTYELQRRLKQTGASTIANAAHPGWTATNLQRDASLFRALNPLLAMSPQQGALPILAAATLPDTSGGDYYGPDGLFELRGWPTKVKSTPAARDQEAAARLWQVSQELTGVSFLGEAS